MRLTKEHGIVESEHGSVCEVVPGHLYATGGTVPTDRSVTWIAPHQKGRLAVSCYVLRDGANALLVDTGLSVHRAAIAEGLATLLHDVPQRAVVLTRREPDAIINLPWLVRTFGIDSVYCGGSLNPVDFFERVDRRLAETQIEVIAHQAVNWLSPTESLRLGALNVRLLRTALCVLPKSHAFEASTGTLFGSDSWGFLSQEKAGPVAVVAKADTRLGRDEIARYLRHKFDWLMGADTTPVQDSVAQLREYKADRICSTYGAVIEGSALVQHVLNETIAALDLLSGEPLTDRMRGFSLSPAVLSHQALRKPTGRGTV